MTAAGVDAAGLWIGTESGRWKWGGMGCRATPATLAITRVRLDGDGYSAGGIYYGVDAPLYLVEDPETGDVYYYIRASNRQHARAMVRSHYPGAKVQR